MASLGELRHRVQIQQETRTANEYGELESTWSTVAYRYASIEPLSGQEPGVAGQVVADRTYMIECRYYDFKPHQRIRWGSRYFNLLPAMNPGERAKGTMIQVMAKEVIG